MWYLIVFPCSLQGRCSGSSHKTAGLKCVSRWGILQVPIALPADSHPCTLASEIKHMVPQQRWAGQILSACGGVQQSHVPVETFSKHIEKVGIQSEPWICYQPISESRGREERQVELMWGQPGRGHADPSVGDGILH